MSINEIRDFIFENYYKRIGFFKKINYNLMRRLSKRDLLLLTNKLIKKIYQMLVMIQSTINQLIIKKKRKSVIESGIITYQPKECDIVDTKSAITEHLKTSHKLS